MSDPLRIDKHRQLFLDGFVIEWRDKLARRVCAVTKCPENPVIWPAADWEPDGYTVYGSVLHDEEEGLYKAWCNCYGAGNAAGRAQAQVRSGVAYFTSPDGVHWDRPELDVLAAGSRPTNIVAVTGQEGQQKGWRYFCELFGVSKDVREPDPARRYKMGYLYLIRDYHGPGEDPLHPGQLRGLGVAFSPDGIHWTALDDAVTQATRDGATHWFYEESTGRYVMYGRGRHTAPELLALHGDELFFQQNHSGRAVRRAESKDFVRWTPDEGRLVLAADALDGPGDEIYSMSVFPYEGIYIGLVQVFHNYPDRVYLDVQLAVSRDSVHFQRLSDRSPFIPVGGAGAWDRFNNSLANNPPVRVGDELRFYYGGRNCLHSGAHKGPDNGREAGLPFLAGVGLGSVKLDRFATLEATFDPGTLRTKPLLFHGRRLHVNTSVRFGRLDVALLDAQGLPIEGLKASVEGQDGVDLPVEMPGLGKRSGTPTRIEFTLRNGQLYSFRVD